MVEFDKKGDSGGCIRSSRWVGMSKENGNGADTIASSSGCRDSLVTYKRRRTGKLVQNGRICDDSDTQLDEKVR